MNRNRWLSLALLLACYCAGWCTSNIVFTPRPWTSLLGALSWFELGQGVFVLLCVLGLEFWLPTARRGQYKGRLW